MVARAFACMHARFACPHMHVGSLFSTMLDAAPALSPRLEIVSHVAACDAAGRMNCSAEGIASAVHAVASLHLDYAIAVVGDSLITCEESRTACIPSKVTGDRIRANMGHILVTRAASIPMALAGPSSVEREARRVRLL